MISWFFIGMVVTILLTPGPTNTLLASSGIQVGIRKSFALIPAEALGYFISISLWGLIIGTVSKQFPSIPVILKLFSAGYILFLALKLWRTANHDEDFNQASIRARELFVATLLNPKALLFAVAFLPQFIHASAPQLPQIIILLATFSVVEMLWYCIYAIGGLSLASYLRQARVLKWFNRVTGGAFIAFAAVMAFVKKA